MSHTDTMIVRLEKDVAEAEAVIEHNVRSAQEGERDLNDFELGSNVEARKRIESAGVQLEELYASSKATVATRKRAGDIATEMSRLRAQADMPDIEYRNAGYYITDYCKAQTGNRDARQRLELFMRTADHQLTDDVPGIVPDPIVGPLINRIDTSRPIITAIGTSPLPSWNWHRPRVTQHTEVGLQTDGTSAPITQKVELASRKMLIERVPVEASTYGGYVNVARQLIDFADPDAMNLIAGDMAGQYAIATEEVAADALAAVATTPVDYPLTPTAAELIGPIWEAAAAAMTAVPEMGRLVLFVAPDRLSAFGPLFAPVNPQNAQSTGFTAGNFRSGNVGNISGIDVVVSKQLDSGEAFMVNTAAVEFYEQVGGQLQVVEPSVLGVQIAYYGYFATLVATAAGVVPLEEGTA